MTFRIPRFLYGTYRDVRKAVGRRLTELKRGRSLAEIAGDDFVEVASDPDALVVLARAWSMVPSDRPLFHVDQPWRQLQARAMRAAIWKPVFARAAIEALDHAWSFAGLLASQLYEVVHTANQQLAFVDAARAHWPVLLEAEPRFTTGSNQGESLLWLPTLLHFALARQGSSIVELQTKMAFTVARLEEFAAILPGYRIREKLRAGDVDGAFELLHGHGEDTTPSLVEHFLACDLDDRVRACIETQKISDPHGIIARQLADRGNSRTAR